MSTRRTKTKWEKMQKLYFKTTITSSLSLGNLPLPLLIVGLLVLLMSLMPAMVTSVRHIDNDEYNYSDDSEFVIGRAGSSSVSSATNAKTLSVNQEQQQQQQAHLKQQQLFLSRRSSSPSNTKPTNRRQNESQHWKRFNKQSYYTNNNSNKNHNKHNLYNSNNNNNNNNNNNKQSMALTKYQSSEAQYADDEEDIDLNDHNYHSIDNNDSEEDNDGAGDIDDDDDDDDHDDINDNNDNNNNNNNMDISMDSRMSTDIKQHTHAPYAILKMNFINNLKYQPTNLTKLITKKKQKTEVP